MAVLEERMNGKKDTIESSRGTLLTQHGQSINSSYKILAYSYLQGGLSVTSVHFRLSLSCAMHK